MAETPIAERLQEELSIYIPSEHLKGAIRVLEDATKAENIHLADGETVEEFKNNTYMALVAEATERGAADAALDVRVTALENLDPVVLPIGIGDVTNLQDTLDDLGEGIATKAPIIHVHDAAQVTSGTFDSARIPAIQISGVTGLQSALDSTASINDSTVSATTAWSSSKIATAKANTVHVHAGEDITTGTIAKARLPVIGIADVNGLSTALAAPPAPSPVVELTGASNTLALTHAGKWLKCNHTSTMTVTIPPQATVAWAANTQIEYEQYGAGVVTIMPGAGVTLRKRSTVTATTSGQYAVAGLKRIGLNEWQIFGDLGTA